MSYQLVEGDTGVILRCTCTENDPPEAIDVTGYTVTLRWRNGEGVQERIMFLLTPEAGIVQYEFVADDVHGPDMEFEIILTDSGGKVRGSLQTFRQRVRERLS